MSIHRREEILVRLKEILNDVDGVVTVDRNRGLRPNDSLPAIFLLDGDETSTKIASGRGRQRMSPVIAIMHPQIFIVLKYEKPTNAGLGESLNAFRGAVVSAIANDEQLLALIGSNGDLTYDGAETDLKTGMPMEGQMQLAFSIHYHFNPYSN